MQSPEKTDGKKRNKGIKKKNNEHAFELSEQQSCQDDCN